MASVARTVPALLRTWTARVSWTVLPVSAVSMWSQKERLAAVADPLRLACCMTVSVWTDPYPHIQAFQDPAWAGSEVPLSRTPEVIAQGEAVPVSKPGLPRI